MAKSGTLTPTGSIKKRVYESILSNILSGEYSPGTLLTEPSLIAKYSVSKTSIREALVQLCSEGVLKNIPRCGYQLVHISVAEIHQLLDLRIILELGALEKTVTRLTGERIGQLYAVLDKNEEEKKDCSVLGSWNRNAAFHLTLCELSDNVYLYNDLQHVLKICSLGANQSVLKTWGEKITVQHSRHYSIVEALQNNDLAAAKKILKSDILSMKNDLFSY